MNKNLRNLCDKARFVSTPDYPDQDVVFERFARNLTIEIIGRIYRHFPESEEAEKLVEEIAWHYGFVDDSCPTDQNQL